MAYLEVRDLRKTFDGTEVLKGVSFSLEKGKVLAVVGSSGNGKTTLLRCLNALETADGGSVFICGEKIFPAGTGEKNGEDKKNEAGIGAETDETANEKTCEKTEEKTDSDELDFTLVFQNFQLFPQYTALRNVSLAADLYEIKRLKAMKMPFSERRKRKKEIKAKNAGAAKKLLEKVGLSEKFNAYPCELSGGQQQRVAIARALALEPDILCFDEPTSALDPELTGEVLRVIKDLKSTGSTMIVVTHEMEFARNVSDKVLFMADGVVEESGTPEEVFGTPQSDKTKSFLNKSLESV